MIILNNVIFILIDSVYSECIGKKKTEESSTPFIDELCKDGFCADNIYSYAPYTDAATIGLYCGIPTLEKLGYYLGINVASTNHFKIFSENGYETYGLFYPYYLISPKTKKYINHPIYTGGFKYGSVWGGKLEYYANIQKERELTQLEYDMVARSLKLTFDCWREFYKDIRNNPEASRIVLDLVSNEFSATGEYGLEAEFQKFESDPQEYIDEVLKLGMSHPLASVNEFDYGKKKDIEFYRNIFKQHRRFFNKVQRKNIKQNLMNNHLDLNKTVSSIKGLLGIGDKQKARYVQNYGMLLAGNKMMQKRALGNPNWQEIASMNKQIEELFFALKTRDKSKNFYASMHVLEPHHNVSYFSFDSFNNELIKEEIEYLMPLVNNCGKGFKGNLLYQLSLRYVDLCIKRLFEKLKKEDLLDNTTVVLVSDHGSSYTFNPIRTQVVNTFHKENYNIPCMIWKKNMNETARKRVGGMFSSEDIITTLCKLEGLKCDKKCSGKVMYEENGRDYIITEYMGPGVPDMLTREVWISIRNSKYVVAYKNNIQETLDVNHPCVVYDLVQDPLELHNLVTENKVFSNQEISNLIEQLNERYKMIQEKTKEAFINLDEIVSEI